MSGAVQAQRGRSGKKWVGLNYDEKERAKDANGGTMPYTLSLVTSAFPHQAEWSEDNLPEILFYIHPPRSRHVGARVVDLIENGQPVASGAADGHNIRDYEILPRNISLEVPGWLIETWRRLDPRIGYQDILDRQYADPKLGLKKHTKNALQNHCRRECRKVLNTWVEYGRRDEPHRTEVESIEHLTPDNIKFNTTLNRSEILPNRLVKVRLERRVDDGLFYAVPCDVTRENWRETTLPLDHFLPNGQKCEMTQEMWAAWMMYIKLTRRAEEHGLNHWKKLDRGCLPVSWYDRTRTKSVPNDTYDGGCAICTWTPGKKDPVSVEVEIKQEVSPMSKAGKRRRTDSRGKKWDIDDMVPKAPKRRLTTRRSVPRPETPSEGSDDASSPGPEGYTYVETYGRTEDEYEYYTIVPQSASLHNDDTEHEGSQQNTSGQDEEGQEDETNPPTNAKSVSSSPDEEEASGIVEQVVIPDPFSTPSGRRIIQPKGPRKSKIAAVGSSVRSQQSPQAGSSLRRSDFLLSDSYSQDIDQGSNSSVENVTPPISQTNEIPGYLPASIFLSRQSSFASVTPPSGPSFSSDNATYGTDASPFVEASHTDIGDYHYLPTATATGFPANHFYPTLMRQSQAAFHNLTYVSPPETVIHQNRLSFMSSPPSRPAPEYEWNQERQRRHSETDATIGLGLNFPSDLAGLSAFTYGSGYVADGQVGNGFELQPTVQDNEFAYADPFESNEPEIGEIATSGDGEYAGMVVDQNMDHYNNDRELFGTETTRTMAPFDFVEV